MSGTVINSSGTTLTFNSIANVDLNGKVTSSFAIKKADNDFYSSYIHFNGKYITVTQPDDDQTAPTNGCTFAIAGDMYLFNTSTTTQASGTTRGVMGIGTGTVAVGDILSVYGGRNYFDKPLGIGTATDALYDLSVNGSSRFIGNVGVGTIPDATHDLLVNGTSSFTGNVGLGIVPDGTYKLKVLGNSYFDGTIGLSNDKSINVYTASGSYGGGVGMGCEYSANGIGFYNTQDSWAHFGFMSNLGMFGLFARFESSLFIVPGSGGAQRSSYNTSASYGQFHSGGLTLNNGIYYGNGSGLTGVSAGSVAWGSITSVPSLCYNNGGTYGINITGSAGSVGSVAWGSISEKPSLVYNNWDWYDINVNGYAKGLWNNAGTYDIRMYDAAGNGYYWDIAVQTNGNYLPGSIRYAASGITDNFCYIDRTNAVRFLDFTGQHGVNSLDKTLFTNKYIGYIACTSKGYFDFSKTYHKDNYKQVIKMNEALPYIELSTKYKQKNVFGVITNERQQLNLSISRKEKELIVNALGEGCIWVCDINGNIESGDFITSSIIPGIGVKQDDDLMHNYTVAKVTMDCDFNPELIPILKSVTSNIPVYREDKIDILNTSNNIIALYNDISINDEIIYCYDIFNNNIIINNSNYYTSNYITSNIYTSNYLISNIYTSNYEIYNYYPITSNYITSNIYTSNIYIFINYEPVHVKDEYNNVLYEPLLDINSNIVYDYEYDMKYIYLDGTITTKDDWVSNHLTSNIYRMAFVGCTYHCG